MAGAFLAGAFLAGAFLAGAFLAASAVLTGAAFLAADLGVAAFWGEAFFDGAFFGGAFFIWAPDFLGAADFLVVAISEHLRVYVNGGLYRFCLSASATLVTMISGSATSASTDDTESARVSAATNSL